jgi:hypothetical protein
MKLQRIFVIQAVAIISGCTKNTIVHASPLDETNKKSKSDKSFIDEIASNSKASEQKLNFDFFKRFVPNNLEASAFLPKDSSEQITEFIKSGIPGQVGYGFLMGLSSGYCLKKVQNNY